MCRILAGMPNQPELSPLELEILGALWKNDTGLKPVEIETHLSEPIKNANLRAILVGMVEKGALKRELRGKAYFYAPARAAKTVRRNLTGRLASIFAEGSRLGLIAQLIRDEKLSPDQIEELKGFANENQPTTNS